MILALTNKKRASQVIGARRTFVKIKPAHASNKIKGRIPQGPTGRNNNSINVNRKSVSHLLMSDPGAIQFFMGMNTFESLEVTPEDPVFLIRFVKLLCAPCRLATACV